MARMYMLRGFLLLLSASLYSRKVLASRVTKVADSPPVVDESSRMPTSDYSAFSEAVQFDSVLYVSAANLVINSLRPDPRISLHMIPRILWEISIMTVAKAASSSKPSLST